MCGVDFEKFPMRDCRDNMVRWRVWLELHICYRITEVSQGELNKNRNVIRTKCGKVSNSHHRAHEQPKGSTTNESGSRLVSFYECLVDWSYKHITEKESGGLPRHCWRLPSSCDQSGARSSGSRIQVTFPRPAGLFHTDQQTQREHFNL